MTDAGNRPGSRAVKAIREHAGVLIVLIGLVAFAFLVFQVDRQQNSDDYWIPDTVSGFANLPDWLTHQYFNWSGRLFSETLFYYILPGSLLTWRVVQISAYLLICHYFYRFYRLFAQVRSRQRDLTALALIMIFPYLMNAAVTLNSVFWVTGAIVYFWALLLLSAAVFPVAHFARRGRLPKWPYVVAGIVAAALIGVAQEQAALLAAGLLATLVIATLYRHGRSTAKAGLVFSLVSLAVVVASFGFYLSAPGNEVRAAAETTAWLPDFYTIPLLEHIEYAARWAMDAIVNRSGVILVLIWLAIAVNHLSTKRLTPHGITATGVSIVAIVLVFGAGVASMSEWTQFYAEWHPTIWTLKTSYAVLAVWLVIVLFTAWMLLMRAKFSMPRSVLASVLYVAAICALVLMTFSPTMYGSGPRVLFFPAVALFFAFLVYWSSISSRDGAETSLGPSRGLIAISIGLAVYVISQYVWLFDSIRAVADA